MRDFVHLHTDLHTDLLMFSQVPGPWFYYPKTLQETSCVHDPQPTECVPVLPILPLALYGAAIQQPLQSRESCQA